MIDWSRERENVSHSIRLSREFASSVSDENEEQYEKYFDPRISRLHGIKIDWSDEGENADDSICVNPEFNSNVIDESERQFEKHFDQRISTSLESRLIEAMTMKIRPIQFVSILNSIQTWLMKVNDNMKNILI
jgi:hypothetical protein